MKAKNLLFIIPVVLMSCFINGCSSGNPDSSVTSTGFDKTVGAKIANETAARWVDRQNPDGARQTQFIFSKESLTAITGKGNLGVALHHAINDAGNYVFLAIAIGPDSKLWTSPYIVDCTTGIRVASSDAKSWATRYRAANEGKVRYHFFGIEVFESIAATEGLGSISLEPALDDSGKPQILILTWSGSSPGGRVAGETLLAAYDFNAPCPNTCDSLD